MTKKPERKAVPPSFLVVRGKKTLFDPDNPAHVRWLGMMVAQMEERLQAQNPQAFQPYPPAFDEEVTEGQFMAWDERMREVDGFNLARNTWAAMQVALMRQGDTSRFSAGEVRAGIVPLGLVAGLNPSAFKTKAQRALMLAFLQTFGLRLGMNTQAWREVRKKMLTQGDAGC